MTDWIIEINRCAQNLANNLAELNTSMETVAKTDDNATRIKISNEYVASRLSTIRTSMQELKNIKDLVDASKK